MANADRQLRRLQFLLNGERLPPSEANADGLHDQLLTAIDANDAGRFKEVANELGQRKIKPESDWCHDDYLLFLLLLGKERFHCPLPFLAQVMDARRKNVNSLPRKMDEVFGAIERGEFGIDGEFGFLKIPFLHLTGKLQLGPADAKKAIQELSAPGLLEQMPPFLKMLTVRAHDLVLLERQPVAAETVAQLIQGLEKHAQEFSLRNWWRVLSALPGKFLWTAVAAIIGLGVIPVLFGIGKGILDRGGAKEARLRPEMIEIVGVREAGLEFPTEVVPIVRSLSQPVGTKMRSLVLSVESAPLVTPTPAFVVEVSHPDKSIRAAFAFVQEIRGGITTFTIVPVQKDGGHFRALLPPLESGGALKFVVEMEIDEDQNVGNIGRRLVLRPLE